jgi:ABC-type branched-subunit amino acid transport system substrate-binding protein
MRSSHRPVVIFLMLLAATALALVAGCGGTTTTTTAASGGTTTAASGSTETTAPASSTTTAAPGGEIPFGFLSSFSGDMAIAGPLWFSGAKMAADDINAAGGVLGKQLKFYQEDDKSSPEEAVKGGRKLISVNRVISINGPLSDSMLAIYPITSEAKVMLTSPGSGSTRLDAFKGNYVFRTCPPDSGMGAGMAKVILDGGYKTVGLMYENTESTQSEVRAMKPILEAGGVKLAAEVAFEPGQPTYKAELKKIADTNPDVVSINSGAATLATILKEAKQSGYKWQWVASNQVMDASIVTAAGAAAMEGIQSVNIGAGADSPSYKDWAARFKQVTGNDVQHLYEANSYDAIIIQALAIAKAGEATGEAINKNYRDVASPPGEKVYNYKDGLAAIQAGKDINYEGVSGPCDFDNIGATPGSFLQMVFKSGKWVELKVFPAQ